GGGDGVVRELRALESCRLSIVSERRRRAPQGRNGGGPGMPGRNLLNGDELPAKVTRDLESGDLVRIETPGGGGYGSPHLTTYSRTKPELAFRHGVGTALHDADTEVPDGLSLPRRLLGRKVRAEAARAGAPARLAGSVTAWSASIGGK